MSFFNELKRRNVFRVGIAYLIGAWLLLQIADVVLNNIAAPDWVFKVIMLIVGIGLPIALFFAWAFELTPDGVKRESEVDRSRSIRTETGQKLNRGIIVILVVALAYFVWESRFGQNSTEPHSVTPVDQMTDNVIPAKAGIQVDPAQKNNQSVAVLPFINMSSDPEQEYFSDGITEEIINALVKIPGLSVPARTSVFGFKGHQGDVRKIGEQLGVAHVLEGSIRTQGNQVRITAQLIKVDDGFHLWSETFDRQLVNIFAVQEEIAKSIATILTGELGLGVTTVPNRTRNMEAYDMYLRGRALLRARDEKAVEVLAETTRSDPGFAPAWAALAIAYQVSGQKEMAMQTAEKALQLDPDNVDALDAMASALRTSLRWLEAEKYFDLALAIDPQSSELLEDYAEFLLYVGRTDEALKVTTRGYAIDSGLLPLTHAHIEALATNGMLDEARSTADRLQAEHPDKQWLWWAALPVRLSQGDITADEQIGKNMNIPAEILQATTAILAERTNEKAVGQLKEMFSVTTMTSPDFDEGYSLARHLLSYAGESEYVLNLDIAIFRVNPQGLKEWGWSTYFKALRQNPRYEEYLQLAGLIEYWDATTWPEWCWRNDDETVECK